MSNGGTGGEPLAGTGSGGMMSDAGSLDSGSEDVDAGTDAAVDDPIGFAGELNGLFVDVPCVASTPLPLADGATCDHTTGTQHIEEAITFGGDASTTYAVTLRVRGIWEPTIIDGGEAPDDAIPFKIGGNVAAGNAIDYQQYSIEVSAPAQTYWLNDHQYVAHDIHKLDYEATIRVTGGATVTVIMNDGNERQIANYTEDFFAGLPPYDTAPSPGQSLHLDVLSVAAE